MLAGGLAPGAEDPEPGPGAPRLRTPGLGAWLVAGGVLACAAIVLALDRPILRATVASLRHIRWEWVGLALVAEGLSVLAAATGHRRLLSAGEHRIGLQPVLAVAYAGAAIASSVPFGGDQVAIAYAFRQYHRRGIDVAVAGWAALIAWMFVSLSLALLLGAGAVASGNLLAAAAGVATAVAFLAPPVGVLLALRYPPARELVTRWADRLAVWCRRVARGHPARDPGTILAGVLARMAALRLPGRRYGSIFALYLCYWLGDVACFALALVAVGVPIPWRGVLLAYGAGVAAGGLGLTPGGVGIVEAALSAALVAAGLHSGEALGAVLVYRLVSFWLVLAVGWVVMVVLARTPAPPLSPVNVEAGASS